MRIFSLPSCPIFSDSSRDVEHLGHGHFDVLLEEAILLPRMESPYDILLLRPGFEVLDDSIEDLAILFISLLEVLLDLVGV